MVTPGDLAVGVLAAVVPSSIAYYAARRANRKDAAVDRRTQERREDQLWGYTDENGIYHEGVVGVVGKLVVAVEHLDETTEHLDEMCALVSARIAVLERPDED